MADLCRKRKCEEGQKLVEDFGFPSPIALSRVTNVGHLALPSQILPAETKFGISEDIYDVLYRHLRSEVRHDTWRSLSARSTLVA